MKYLRINRTKLIASIVIALCLCGGYVSTTAVFKAGAAALCVTNPEIELCSFWTTLTPDSTSVTSGTSVDLTAEVGGILQYEVKVDDFEVSMLDTDGNWTTLLTYPGVVCQYGCTRNVSTGPLTKSVNVYAMAMNRQGTIAEDMTSIVVSAGVGNINVSANIAGANWTITGPTVLTGTGIAQSYSGVSVGTYTLTWGAVAGYNTPPVQSLTLTAGNTLNFAVGNYSASCTWVQTKDPVMNDYVEVRNCVGLPPSQNACTAPNSSCGFGGGWFMGAPYPTCPGGITEGAVSTQANGYRCWGGITVNPTGIAAEGGMCYAKPVFTTVCSGATPSVELQFTQ